MICIGKPIIQILARDGAWKSENGDEVIAADELFHNDPYAEIKRLRADVDALSRTLNGLANRPDFANKVLEVRRKADKALEARRALEPMP